MLAAGAKAKHIKLLESLQHQCIAMSDLKPGVLVCDAHEPDPLTRFAHVTQRGCFRAKNSRDTRGKPRGKKRGGGLGEKELQLSSQTRTICLICVTCFLLI